MIEKIAYLEQADHQYIHVASTDKSLPGHASFSREENHTGELIIASHSGGFKPVLWNFVAKDIEPGVYKKSDIDVNLLPNQKIK
jgi:hypothetical protein